jgi:hypothetical protein
MLEGINAKTADLIKQIEMEFKQWQEQGMVGGLDQLEKKVKAVTSQIGQNILQSVVKEIENHPEPKDQMDAMNRCPDCGRQRHYKYQSSKEVWTVCGRIKIKRKYYYCQHCGKGEYSLDHTLGLNESNLSGTVRRLISLVGAELPFERTQELIYEVGGIYLSKATVWRVTHQVGRELRNVQRQVQSEYLLMGQVDNEDQLDQVDKVIAETDATSVLTTEGYRQPKLSVVVQKDQGGNKLQSRYQGGFMTVEELAWGWEADAKGLGWQRVKKKEVLSDGADWIWNIALAHLPDGEAIIDYYHPCERIHQIGLWAFGEGNAAGKKWVNKMVEALKSGRIGKIIKRLEGLKGSSKQSKEMIQEGITYFNNNGHRMNYPAYQKEGYDIGSGIIEGGCKFIIAGRLKRSGMRWKMENVNNMITLRTAILNKKEWKIFWDAYHVAC